MKKIQLALMGGVCVCAVLLSAMCFYRGHQQGGDTLCYAVGACFVINAIIAGLTVRSIYNEK